MDRRPVYLRPCVGVGTQHLAYWRSPFAHLYSLLPVERALFDDDHASAARSNGRSAGRTDEDDAVDDVPYARDVLLHVQRLLIGT